ncbi:hypothetical protein JCM13580A_40830 [Streptomyces drozdowiczii]
MFACGAKEVLDLQEVAGDLEVAVAAVHGSGGSSAGCEYGVGRGGLVARTGAVVPQGPCGGRSGTSGPSRSGSYDGVGGINS